ncbi:MAG: glycine cleavage T C-terminal barrel domain-containing protein, partial [Paracoccaceae bacterium]|nr:glycine cleavage T C-terminal barrel domain-containing protein [Paracoccaceae bacterium]
DVKISEPDVYPLAVQGPKAEKLLSEIFGSHIKNIKFFKFNWIDVNGSSQLIARSGYSRQGGFEIYLRGESYAKFLWDIIWERGQSYQIAPGCPNLIERIEGGLFSYGNEMTIANNPFEIGLEKFCDLDGSIEYIGKSKLQEIHKNGVQKIIRGFIFGETPCPTCSKPWPVYANGNAVGNITSAIWSPRLKANVAQGMVDKDYWDIGQRVKIKVQDGSEMIGTIKDFPL